MWELAINEDWAPKNWCLRTVVLEKTLESPLDSKKIKSINPKGNQLWIFTGRTDAQAEIQYPMDCSPPGSSVHIILQARILEGIVIPFSRGSPQPKALTQISYIASRFFTVWATRETQCLTTWCEEPNHCIRPWCWERLKERKEKGVWEDEGCIASLDQWVWIWVNYAR